MDLNEISVFIQVVEKGSFTKAAAALDMPKSTVSAKITSLEARLGATLIQRTTRKLHITDVGSDYYQQCLQAISQIKEAEKQVTQDQSTPQGLLRISAPIELGGTLLPHVICEFQKKYPKVELEVILSDHYVDFVSERIDIALRVGLLKDSTLVAKKIGNIYFAPFASNRYLKIYSEPKTPMDLEEHRSIVFTNMGEKWELYSQNSSQVIRVNKAVRINELNLIKNLTISGQGIALLPTFLCLQEVKSGKLVRILKKWRTNEKPLHMVYPSQKFISPKSRAFIDLASEILRKTLGTAEL